MRVHHANWRPKTTALIFVWHDGRMIKPKVVLLIFVVLTGAKVNILCLHHIFRVRYAALTQSRNIHDFKHILPCDERNPEAVVTSPSPLNTPTSFHETSPLSAIKILIACGRPLSDPKLKTSSKTSILSSSAISPNEHDSADVNNRNNIEHIT